MPPRNERRQRHEPEPTIFRRVADAITTHPRISAGIATGLTIPMLGGYVLFHSGQENPAIPTPTATGRPFGPEPAPLTLEQAREASRAAFVKRLESFFDFTPDISRAELARKLYPITYVNKTWGTNMRLGILKNSRGQDISVTTMNNGGVESFGFFESKGFIYPTDDAPKRTIIQKDKNFLVIYGTKETTSKFEDDPTQKIVKQFLVEYFGDVESRFNVLHLNFFPPSFPIALEALGEDLGEISPPGLDEGSIATNTTLRSNISGYPERKDVNINIPSLHSGNAKLQEFSLVEDLRVTLANEAGNFLATNGTRQRLLSSNEAPSSLLGYLAGLDQRWARLMLGGDTYGDFLPLVAKEMERIGKVR